MACTEDREALPPWGGWGVAYRFQGLGSMRTTPAGDRSCLCLPRTKLQRGLSHPRRQDVPLCAPRGACDWAASFAAWLEKKPFKKSKTHMPPQPLPLWRFQEEKSGSSTSHTSPSSRAREAYPALECGPHLLRSLKCRFLGPIPGPLSLALWGST